MFSMRSQTEGREITTAHFEDIPQLGRYNIYYYSVLIFRYSVIWEFKFLLLALIMCWAPFHSHWRQWEMKKACTTQGQCPLSHQLRYDILQTADIHGFTGCSCSDFIASFAWVKHKQAEFLRISFEILSTCVSS